MLTKPNVHVMLDELAEVRHHLNRDHADTVGLIGHFLICHRVDDKEAVTATIGTIGTIDQHGVCFVVARPGSAAVEARHEFDAECATIDDVRLDFFGLLSAARDWIGDEAPLTSLERELRGSDISTFMSEVVAVVDITPHLRQITFGGGLDGFVSLGGDQFLYVLLPPPGRSDLTIDAAFNWIAFEEMPEFERPAGAYYTVRAWREEERELDMWFVLHGDEGASSAWAQNAEPGQPVGLWGPRRAFEPPAATSSYLLVADETGFGAVGAILDQLLAVNPSTTAHVIVETDGLDGRVEFPTGPNVDINWVDRAGQAPGTTSLLLDTVRESSFADGLYAFGAGESRRITQVRRHLRDGVGLDSASVSMTGYWRS